MSNTYCPKCDKITPIVRYRTWQIIVAICFFPLGLFALKEDMKSPKCKKCGYTWKV